MDTKTVMFQSWYDQLLTLNDQAFHENCFDIAYLTLWAAFQCANEMKSRQMMTRVGELAIQELAWIDQNNAEYHNSTQSTEERHSGKSIYERLSIQAKRILEVQKLIEDARSLRVTYLLRSSFR